MFSTTKNEPFASARVPWQSTALHRATDCVVIVRKKSIYWPFLQVLDMPSFLLLQHLMRPLPTQFEVPERIKKREKKRWFISILFLHEMGIFWNPELQ